MKTGKLEIIENENDGKTSIVFEPVNGNVWLTKNEIANLFSVITPVITNKLRAIFKNNICYEAEASYLHRYTDRQGQEWQCVYYNLDVVLALVWSIKSERSDMIRKWIIRKLISNCYNSKTANEPIVLVKWHTEQLN